MDLPIIAVLLLFFFLEGIIQDDVKYIVRSMIEAKIELLNNATELVWARPGDSMYV